MKINKLLLMSVLFSACVLFSQFAKASDESDSEEADTFTAGMMIITQGNMNNKGVAEALKHFWEAHEEGNQGAKPILDFFYGAMNKSRLVGCVLADFAEGNKKSLGYLKSALTSIDNRGDALDVSKIIIDLEDMRDALDEKNEVLNKLYSVTETKSFDQWHCEQVFGKISDYRRHCATAVRAMKRSNTFLLSCFTPTGELIADISKLQSLSEPSYVNVTKVSDADFVTFGDESKEQLDSTLSIVSEGEQLKIEGYITHAQLSKDFQNKFIGFCDRYAEKDKKSDKPAKIKEAALEVQKLINDLHDSFIALIVKGAEARNQSFLAVYNIFDDH